MKNLKAVLVVLIFSAAVPVYASGFRITVSLPPMAQFVEKVAGTANEITVLIPDNQTPHTYSPTPRQLIALEDADLYYSVGMPQYIMETRYIYPFLENHPDILHLKMSSALELLPAEGHSHDEEGHGDGDHYVHYEDYDPHIWLGPENVVRSAEELRDIFIRMDPEHADMYRRNAEIFIAEIREMQDQIRSVLSDMPSKKFMVYHPAWSYFAHEFDLTQVAIENAGKEPGPRQLIQIIDQARSEKIRVIFVQKGFSTQSAEVIAGEIGARVVELNPLDRDWLANLKQSANAFASSGRKP